LLNVILIFPGRKFLEGLTIYKRGYWKKDFRIYSNKNCKSSGKSCTKVFSTPKENTRAKEKKKHINDIVFEPWHGVQVQKRIHINAANQRIFQRHSSYTI